MRQLHEVQLSDASQKPLCSAYLHPVQHHGYEPLGVALSSVDAAAPLLRLPGCQSSQAARVRPRREPMQHQQLLEEKRIIDAA